jgi:hypothetical protein
MKTRNYIRIILELYWNIIGVISELYQSFTTKDMAKKSKNRFFSWIVNHSTIGIKTTKGLILTILFVNMNLKILPLSIRYHMLKYISVIVIEKKLLLELLWFWIFGNHFVFKKI